MRKWIFIGISVAVIGVAGYWFMPRKNISLPARERPDRHFPVTQQARNDGAAEPRVVIEPLIVDRGVVPSAPESGPTDRVLLPRVEWTPGAPQPPRPDIEPGQLLRMPYADEHEILRIPLDPLQRILDSSLPRLDLSEAWKDDPTEESEPRETPAPPAYDPHHPSHCPHFGGCPAPFPYRVR